MASALLVPLRRLGGHGACRAEQRTVLKDFTQTVRDRLRATLAPVSPPYPPRKRTGSLVSVKPPLPSGRTL